MVLHKKDNPLQATEHLSASFYAMLPAHCFGLWLLILGLVGSQERHDGCTLFRILHIEDSLSPDMWSCGTGSAHRRGGDVGVEICKLAAEPSLGAGGEVDKLPANAVNFQYKL